MDKSTLYKIIGCACAVFIYFFPAILPKYKKYKKLINLLAIIAITVPFFVSFEQEQKPTKLSEEDIQKIVDKLAVAIKPQLMSMYPTGSFSFGVYKKKIIRSKNPFIRFFEVNWGSGKIIQATDKTIKIKLPDFKIVISQDIFIDNIVAIQKKTGSKICPFFLSGLNLKVCVEVISINLDIVMVGVGIVNIK